MYLSELRKLSEALLQFFGVMPIPSKMFQKTLSYHCESFAKFYMDVFVIHRKVEAEIKNTEEMLEKGEEYEQDDSRVIQQENLRESIGSKLDEVSQASNNTEDSCQTNKKSLSAPIPSLSPSRLKLKNWSFNPQNPNFLEIIENLHSLKKYKNQIDYFRTELSKFTEILHTIEQYFSECKTQNEVTSVYFDAVVHVDCEDIVEHVVGVLRRCDEIQVKIREIKENQTNSESSLSNSACSSVSAPKSLLTEILKNRQNSKKISETSNKLPSKHRSRTLKMPDSEKLIIPKIDFQNYELRNRPKQKKVRFVDPERCSICTIF